MKTLFLLSLLTLLSCGDKRTLSTPINDLTPAPSLELLQALKFQDCATKFTQLQKDLWPVELIAASALCVDEGVAKKLLEVKGFFTDKNIERVYLSNSPETLLGFDIESVRSARVSLAFPEDKVQFEALWERQRRELRRDFFKTPSVKVPHIYIDGIVAPKTDDLKKITHVMEALNQSEEFVREMDLMRTEKGDFPIFISFDRCVAAEDGLYILIKPRSVFGTSLGAAKKCLEKLKKVPASEEAGTVL